MVSRKSVPISGQWCPGRQSCTSSDGDPVSTGQGWGVVTMFRGHPLLSSYSSSHCWHSLASSDSDIKKGFFGNGEIYQILNMNHDHY